MFHLCSIVFACLRVSSGDIFEWWASGRSWHIDIFSLVAYGILHTTYSCGNGRLDVRMHSVQPICDRKKLNWKFVMERRMHAKYCWVLESIIEKKKKLKKREIAEQFHFTLINLQFLILVATNRSQWSFCGSIFSRWILAQIYISFSFSRPN